MMDPWNKLLENSKKRPLLQDKQKHNLFHNHTALVQRNLHLLIVLDKTIKNLEFWHTRG